MAPSSTPPSLIEVVSLQLPDRNCDSLPNASDDVYTESLSKDCAKVADSEQIAALAKQLRHRVQAEAELAAAVTEIEATLLDLKRERLLAQLGGSTAGGNSSGAASDAAYATTGSESALPALALAHGGMQPSSTADHSDVRIGE